MITVPAGMRVLVATKPVDFRRGADGLVALVREQLGHDPFSGTFWKPTFYPNHRARNPHPGDGLDPLLGPRIFRALRLGPFEGFPAGSLEPPVPAKGSVPAK